MAKINKALAQPVKEERLVVLNEYVTKENIDTFAKEHPGGLSYASQGVGSTAHLSASQLEALAGIKMVHVPYRGAQPALTDVMAGNVDLFFDTPTTSVPLYRNKMIKILAVADLERPPALPEVPTFSEAGLPGFAPSNSVKAGCTTRLSIRSA